MSHKFNDDDSKISGFADFLEGIFEEISKARIEKNIINWYDLLVVATLNLSPEMSIEQVKEFRTLKDTLYKYVLKSNNEGSIINLNIISFELENKLFDWELDLRKIRRDSHLQHKLVNPKRRFT